MICRELNLAGIESRVMVEILNLLREKMEVPDGKSGKKRRISYWEMVKENPQTEIIYLTYIPDHFYDRPTWGVVTLKDVKEFLEGWVVQTAVIINIRNLMDEAMEKTG
jgi:hypothetical protein